MASVLCVLLRTPRKRLGVLHLDRGPMQVPFTKDDLKLADALAAHVSAGIESAQLIRKERELFNNTVFMLAQAVEMRDPYTGGHTQRVTEYSTLLGQELQLTVDDMHLIRIGTPLHDIGKIGIDDKILRKPEKLTPAEFDIMKTHTTKGAKILEQVADLAPVIPIVLSHHERWDGGGYPDGLVGEAIPLEARIVCCCDAFNAMTTTRSYRAAMPLDVALEELQRCAGTQFDPPFVRALVAAVEANGWDPAAVPLFPPAPEPTSADSTSSDSTSSDSASSDPMSSESFDHYDHDDPEDAAAYVAPRTAS